jgi:hypothetical protein
MARAPCLSQLKQGINKNLHELGHTTIALGSNLPGAVTSSCTMLPEATGLPSKDDQSNTGSLTKGTCLSNLWSNWGVRVNTPGLSMQCESLGFNIAANGQSVAKCDWPSS